MSVATLGSWRRTYGGMDTGAAKELKELREQNGRLKRPRAEAELEKDALREVPSGRHAHYHIECVGTVGVQGGWAGPLHLATTASSADAG